MGGRVVFFVFVVFSVFPVFVGLVAFLLCCCNPTTKQPNKPTTQQPNIPTTQHPNNPTTQQPNNPTNNPATQQSSKQKTTQPPNNPTTTQSPTTPSQKNYQSSLFFGQIGCLSRFFRLQLLSFFLRFLTILGCSGAPLGYFGELFWE